MSLTHTDRYPQWDVEFTQNNSTVEIKLCNERGERTPLAIQQRQIPRLAIKYAQGGTKHADYEGPYTPIEQRDFSGGRGWDDADTDATRYSDGWQVDPSMENITILGPQPVYTTGYRNIDQHWPHRDSDGNDTYVTYNWESLTGSSQYLARKFSASATYSADKAYIWVRKRGTPNDNLELHIYDDSAGDPNSSQKSITLAPGDVGSDLAELVELDWSTTQSLTSGTDYWVVVLAASGSDNSTNHWEVLTETTSAGTGQKNSSDGSTWSQYDEEIIFRIVDADSHFRAMFFEMTGALFCALNYDNGNAGKVYINGEQGVATSATSNTLTDSTKSWTTDEWKDAVVKIVLGQGHTADVNYATISSNTSTALTINGTWDVTPGSGSWYVIVGSEKWTEITGHGWAGGPTDVLSVNHIAYFAMGPNEDMWRLRRYRGSSNTWTTTWVQEESNRAKLLQFAPDSHGDWYIWASRGDWVEWVDKAQPVWGGGRSTVDDLSFDETDLVTNGSMEADSSWSDVGTPAINQQSSNIVHSGTYSRAVAADADDEGITQSITTTADTGYQVKAWVYIPASVRVIDFDAGTDEFTYGETVTGGNSGATGTALEWIVDSGDWATNDAAGHLYMNSVSGTFQNNESLTGSSTGAATANGADSAAANNLTMEFAGTELDTTTTTDAWTLLEGMEKASGTSHNLQFLSDGGAGLFYVDDVRIDDRPTYLPDIGHERITGLERYGEPERLWVLTEGNVYKEDFGDFLAIPLREIQSVEDSRNGRGHLVHNLYLYFSLQNGLERYYKSNLDDVGPNRDEGLPSDREGSIVDMVGYAGKFFAAVDGGDDNYSSVLMYNGFGWHEVWRAPVTGQHIRGLHIQAIPGDTVDRLWISCGSDILWVPVSINPLGDSDYRYAPEGSLITAYYHADLKDVDKYFDDLTIFGDNLSGNVEIEVDYRTDNSTAWTALANASSVPIPFDTTPSEANDFSTSSDVNGKRIQLRLRFMTDHNTTTPELKALVIAALKVIPYKNAYTMRFLLEDDNPTLVGRKTYERYESTTTGYGELQDFIDQALPATMRSRISAFDNKTVKIISAEARPIRVSSKAQHEKVIATLEVIEI